MKCRPLIHFFQLQSLTVLNKCGAILIFLPVVLCPFQVDRGKQELFVEKHLCLECGPCDNEHKVRGYQARTGTWACVHSVHQCQCWDLVLGHRLTRPRLSIIAQVSGTGEILDRTGAGDMASVKIIVYCRVCGDSRLKYSGQGQEQTMVLSVMIANNEDYIIIAYHLSMFYQLLRGFIFYVSFNQLPSFTNHRLNHTKILISITTTNCFKS